MTSQGSEHGRFQRVIRDRHLRRAPRHGHATVVALFSPNSDADASLELATALEDEGIEIITSTFVKSVRKDGDEIVTTGWVSRNATVSHTGTRTSFSAGCY